MYLVLTEVEAVEVVHVAIVLAPKYVHAPFEYYC